jgi:predicted ester cyclase
MTLDESKKLILDHYEAFVHRQDAEAVRAQLTPDFVDHEMPPGTPTGPEAAIQWRAMLHQAFPDMRVKIEDIVAEGDRVAVRATWTATHSGYFPPMNASPTNRRIAFSGMVLWRISGNRIAERWATLDRLSLQQQLSARS